MKSVLIPFNSSVWLTLLLIMYLSIFIIIMTKLFTNKWRHFVIRGRMNRAPIPNAWATVLGHSIHNPLIIINGRSFGNFARTLTIDWIILWFIVSITICKVTSHRPMTQSKRYSHRTAEKLWYRTCDNMPQFWHITSQ